jgi:hypothetical protein
VNADPSEDSAQEADSWAEWRFVALERTSIPGGRRLAAHRGLFGIRRGKPQQNDSRRKLHASRGAELALLAPPSRAAPYEQTRLLRDLGETPGAAHPAAFIDKHEGKRRLLGEVQK